MLTCGLREVLILDKDLVPLTPDWVNIIGIGVIKPLNNKPRQISCKTRIFVKISTLFSVNILIFSKHVDFNAKYSILFWPKRKMAKSYVFYDRW